MTSVSVTYLELTDDGIELPVELRHDICQQMEFGCLVGQVPCQL